MEIPPELQPMVIIAELYASLFLKVLENLFPERQLQNLSDDERRIIQNETDLLLARSRWRLQSDVFRPVLTMPSPTEPKIPNETVPGSPTSSGDHVKPPGLYL